MANSASRISPSKTFKFVVSEAVRHHQEIFDRSRSPRESNEFPSWIQLPTRGIRIIGMEAERKLYALAERKIERDPDLKGRLEISALVQNFKKELGVEFEAVTGRTADEIVKNQFRMRKPL